MDATRSGLSVSEQEQGLRARYNSNNHSNSNNKNTNNNSKSISSNKNMLSCIAIFAVSAAILVAVARAAGGKKLPEDVWNGIGECEGYWPPVSECLNPSGAGPAEGCPQHYVVADSAWPERESFLAKARAIEKAASEADRNLQASCQEGLSPFVPHSSEWKNELDKLSLKVVSYRGISFSRIEDGAIVGSRGFSDAAGGACWPDGYVDHYVGEHHVRASLRFQRYVQSFPLVEFQSAVDALLQACEAKRHHGQGFRASSKPSEHEP